ncbi:ATPase, T2SS/T4P/T4SS family [Alicyclobacillus tolerans]|uniref:Pilus assembly protein CpaF n=1 Tax=Alicyclobacillus tolerans TaxID=90970 RepID=A0ABT9LVG4_9BACL|nr:MULTISPECIES: ATPase, T2SS/T4P/T4SS family [Alicyclobacillus]MDP9728273.1 pilus assembly protein CpaF [Alicyclobacillus tengchongensis]QRF23478.1 CpaF family protein [Alicyclobacillus sp. TC]
MTGILEELEKLQQESEAYFAEDEAVLERQKEVEKETRRLMERVREENEWLRNLPPRREAHAYLGRLAGLIRIPARYQEEAIQEVLNNMYGYGKLQAVMDDPYISDIMVIGGTQVIVTRRGEREVVPGLVMQNEEIVDFVSKKLSGTTYKFDLANPRCDAMLADGYRMHVRGGASAWTVKDEFGVILPRECMFLTVRKPLFNFSLEQLMELRMLSPEMVQLFALFPTLHYSYVVAGGTGSAKSTLCAAILGHVPENEVVGIVEEMPELQPLCRWSARLYNKGANAEGKGEITMLDSIADTLRMFFDHVGVGEIRMEAMAYAFLQAGLSVTGHTFTTVHAPPQAQGIVQRMCLLAAGAPQKPAMSTVANIFTSVTQVVIGCERTRFGKRVVEVSEIYPYDPSTKTVPFVRLATWNGEKDVFVFHGMTPRMVERAKRQGISLPDLPIQKNPQFEQVYLG